MRKKYYNLFWLESVWINRRAFSLRESLLFLVELNAPDTKITTCVMKGARQERRSRARALPLINLKKKGKRESLLPIYRTIVMGVDTNEY